MLDRIDHVGIVVPDLEAAMVRYTAVFGARLVCRQYQPVHGIDECMLALGESLPGSGTYVQLLEPQGDSVFRDFLVETGGGLHHVAYAVADVDEAWRELVARGMTPMGDIYRAGTMGAQVFFLDSAMTANVLTEIVQPGGSWGPFDPPTRR